MGIDPGKTGAAALYERGDTFYGRALDAVDLPIASIQGLEVIDAPALVRQIQAWKPDFVWLERVWAMPLHHDDSRKDFQGMGTPAAFAFGDVFGTVRTTVLLDGWRMTMVTPQTWKKFFGLKGPDKDQSRRRALELMPEAARFIYRKRDNGRAEALLIARYGAMVAWTGAGGAVPAAEVRPGRELAAATSQARARRRDLAERHAELDTEEIPE